MTMQESWLEEKTSAYLYTVMAKTETHPLRKTLFLELAKAAQDQAVLWEQQMLNAQQQVPTSFEPNFRTRLVGWLVQKIGPEKLRYILSAMKVRGMSVFQAHAHETLHRGINTAGNLRAAVFGVNDGLVSNMSLILGLVGANTDPSFIILTGIAGLLAGACSMASGEYISMRSQREVFEHQIQLEKNELEMYPEEEMEELALIYQARGISKEESTQLAELMIRNPKTALDTLAREELGLNPEELGSPVGAMISSFFSFAIGAFIPLVPFLINRNIKMISMSVLITAFTLFSIGALLSLYTNKNAWKGGFRMLLVGAIAGAMTYFIGKGIGIKIH